MKGVTREAAGRAQKIEGGLFFSFVVLGLKMGSNLAYLFSLEKGVVGVKDTVE